MNLQEILNYRDTCIHCGREMKMHIEGYPKLTVTKTDTGLEIKSNKPGGAYLHFGFDGKYTHNKRNYKIYSKPLLIRKYCHFHPMYSYVAPPAVGLSQQLGIGFGTPGTSINNVKDTTCHYEFIVFGDSQGNYDANMAIDLIYWHDDEQFWHANTFFTPLNKSYLYHGNYGQKIEQVLSLTIPPLNLRNVKSKEQFIEKLKLYALFS